MGYGWVSPDPDSVAAGNIDTIISPGCRAGAALARNQFPVCGHFLSNDKNESLYNIYF